LDDETDLSETNYSVKKSCYALIVYSFGEPFIKEINKLHGTDLLLQLFAVVENEGADLIMQVLGNCAEGNREMCEILAARATEYIYRFENSDVTLQDSMLHLFCFVASVETAHSILRKVYHLILDVAVDHHKPLDTRLFANMTLAFLADSKMVEELSNDACQASRNSIIKFINTITQNYRFRYTFLTVDPYKSLFDSPFPEPICFVLFFILLYCRN